MRILQVNKFLYRKAGAEAYVLDLVELLRQNKHEVVLWGTRTELSSVQSAAQSLALVSPLNFDRREGWWRDLRKVGHMVWSWESARKFEQVLREFKPEVVHLHNIYHHISPSILPVAARYKVPVVMTVHDWHLINPNYNLFDHGEICERNGLAAIAHRCIKNSYAASLADVIEWRIHKWMRVYAKHVAKFIVPNEFVKGKLVNGGVEVKKIEMVPLPVAPTPPNLPSGRGGNDSFSPPLGGGVRGGQEYILFSGRLTVEKGIYVLLEMAKQMPEIKFKIAGGGSEQTNIQYLISNFQLPNVELLGFVEKVALQKLIAGARLIVVPSLWEELSPLAVLEAMALGKVVVASRMGGIAELIEEGKTGFLVDRTNYEQIANLRTGDQSRMFVPVRQFVRDWVDKLKKLYYDEPLLKKVGKAAKEYVERVHGGEQHYASLMQIYNSIK